jgi:hypothetical protein
MTPYKPNPIDTSQTSLPTGLEALVERLSENNHDHWAQQRMAEGWQYGPNRNDVSKQHPGLVPYSDLSESEKEYDRKTVVEAIKAIMALGYKVEQG